ncbi:MAG TPA: tRNA preQ1(34) S-adenosylmethionine ribosyltransferase-isomerase QueA [Terriglobales bacterium]|nr:tRNA preQ1(34) S-adenosylmethionine ribosyltransferase-isomerase QueA [Terriglobales bacterium]
MLVSDFDYHLPEELIAQQPLADRAASRLLHVNRGRDVLRDCHFRDFPGMLRPDDLLVLNNSKVLPARLYGHRSGSRAQKVSQGNAAARDFLRGRVEVLLTKQLSSSPNEWEALVHPGRKLGIGERIYFGAGASESSHELAGEIVGRGTFGERRLRFDPAVDFFEVLSRIGHIPLPPYIDRPDQLEDRQQYQTVYAKPPGSVAAPTAGLHFTAEILERIRQRGVETAELTLHVGLGTFQPVRVEVVEEHRLHTESFDIPPETAERIQSARDAGRRIVAVGTTTVRTLEYAARQGADGRITGQRGEADIFIYPGFGFRVVGAMLTNFHLPKSTLLMLVSAFAGRERVRRAYEHAVGQRYRFYSYGDCMFVE